MHSGALGDMYGGHWVGVEDGGIVIDQVPSDKKS